MYTAIQNLKPSATHPARFQVSRRRPLLVACVALLCLLPGFSFAQTTQEKLKASPQPHIEVPAHQAPGHDSPDNLDASLDHGPHAGFMRGQGDIQSELLLGPGNGFRLYLVDKSWMGLDLHESSIEVIVKRSAGNQPLRCAIKPSTEAPEYYTCEFLKESVLGMGDVLFVKFTNREKAEETFNYTFPFSAHEPKLPFPAVQATSNAAASVGSSSSS